MSLSDNYKPVKYIGNGATKDFSFDFNMINREYCRVFLEDKTTGAQTPKTIEVDYTLVFDENGGQVSMKVAPTADQYIVVYRDVDLSQKSDFRVGEGFAAVKVEDEFDKQMAAIQQMKDGLNRAPKVAEGFNLNLTLPAPDAGKALIWNATKNGFKNSTVDVDHLEEVTQQYRDEAQAARDAAQVAETNAKASESEAKAQADRAQGISDAFDANAVAKTQEFDANAQQKQAAVDASAAAAKQSEDNAADSAEESKQYATKASFGNIGDIKYTARTDVPNGGAWCDGAEYTQEAFPDIYQMLVDGKIQSTTYQNFTNSVSTNGSCGFFALDTSAQKFKVPMLKDVYIKAGNTPSMFGAESLPDHKHGSYSRTQYAGGSAVSACQDDPNLSPTPNLEAYGVQNSEVYKPNAKVNPDHVVYRAYVVLYSSAAEASEAQVQEFMTALGGKANVGLDNINAQAKNLIAGLGMPSSNYIDIDGSTTSRFVIQDWVAPANGFVTIRGITSTTTNGSVYLQVEINGLYYYTSGTFANGHVYGSIIVPKGGKVTINCSGSSVYLSTINTLRFIYAEGSRE